MQEKKLTAKAKTIKINKFYLIFDGSRTGHPGYIVSKDDTKNRYIVIRIESDKPGETTKEQRGVRHITRLKHPTSPKVLNSYVKNRPMVCKRNDIGSKELIGISFHLEDMPLIKQISKRNPEFSRSFKIKK